jgi:hypothetical protein
MMLKIAIEAIAANTATLLAAVMLLRETLRAAVFFF